MRVILFVVLIGFTSSLASCHLLDDLLDFVTPNKNKTRHPNVVTSTTSAVSLESNKILDIESSAEQIQKGQPNVRMFGDGVEPISRDDKLNEINLNVRSSLMVMQIIQSQHEQQLQSISAQLRKINFGLDRLIDKFDEFTIFQPQVIASVVGRIVKNIENDVTPKIRINAQSNENSPIPSKLQLRTDLSSTERATPTSHTSSNMIDDDAKHNRAESLKSSSRAPNSLNDNDNNKTNTNADHDDKKPMVKLPWPNLNQTNQIKITTNEQSNDENVRTNEGDRNDQEDNNNKPGLMTLDVNALSQSISDQVATVVKQVHTGTQNQINKLINKAFDHSSQFNSLYDLLLEIKDECSASTLAASGPNQRPATSANQSNEPKTNNPNAGEEHAVAGNSWSLRSSDMSMLTHVIQEIGINQSSLCHSDARRLVNETRNISRQVTEMSSIVKQVALIVTRLQNGRPEMATTVVTYDTQSNAVVDANNSVEATAKPQMERRSGSVIDQQQDDEQQISSAPPTIKCNSASHVIAPKSCHDLARNGANCSGIYFVYVDRNVQRVYCEFDGQKSTGWTLLARRIDKTREPSTLSSSSGAHSTSTHRQQSIRWPKRMRTNAENELIRRLKSFKVSFDQDWQAYKDGFGHLDDWGEFWLGLAFMHKLTHSYGPNHPVEAQIDLQTSTGETLHLLYDNFKIDNETNRFRLTIGHCNDTRGEQFAARHNGTTFWTYDRPLIERQSAASSSLGLVNDNVPVSTKVIINQTAFSLNNMARECARQIHAGWWYDGDHISHIDSPCHSGLITGPTVAGTADADETIANPISMGLRWLTWNDGQPLYRLTLKVRPFERSSSKIHFNSSSTFIAA